MKAPKNSRSVALVILSAIMSIGVVAFALQATGAATSTLAAPTIVLKPANPAASTSATFTFTGPALATFQCQLDGATFTTCTSPKSYSGLGQGLRTFGVRAVSGSKVSAAASYSWTVDTTPPPAPVFTTQPNDPTPNATNTFAWSVTPNEVGLTYRCEVENGSWFACSTPYTYVIATQNNQQHQFSVRAVDAAGNVSRAVSYSYKYEQGSNAAGQPFTISGNLSGLAPGTSLPLELTLRNPNKKALSVTNLSVTIQSVTRGGGVTLPCLIGDYAVIQYSGPYPLLLPGSLLPMTLSALGVPPDQRPKVVFRNTPFNQDGCKGATLNLSYSGSGQGN